MAVVGSHVFVADKGLRVISIADPANPVEVGYWQCSSGLGGAHDIVLRGEYAYVADNSYGLWIVSIADTTHPVEVGYWDGGGGAMGVAACEGLAYLAEQDSCLSVISVADPAHPVRVGRWSDTYGFGLDVAVDGDYAYVARRSSGLYVFSVADPTQPVVVGACDVPFPGATWGLTLRGQYVYTAALSTGLRVISIADPANPVEVGYCDTPGTALDVAVHGDYAYVADSDSGLRVISIADPANPVEVGYFNTAGRALGVAVYHDLILVSYERGFGVFQFSTPGDLDIDNDSLDVAADTLRPRRWTKVVGDSLECVRGEFVLANTSTPYNPDSIDGPSVSPVDSLRCAGSLVGPGGTIDSIVVVNLLESLAQGQTLVCTLAAYVPVGMDVGYYTGTVYVSGRDTANLQVYESCYVCVSKLGDLDVDNDSLDAVADTLRLPPADSAGLVRGEFVLTNTSAAYNPDTADGPSLSRVDSLRFTTSLAGPGGTVDSVLIQGFPASLAQGQTVVCTLVVYLPESLPVGDYKGPIVITGLDSVRYPVAETVYALAKRVVGVLGDLDVDNDSLDVVHDTMNLRTQPAGPVYHPYAKARFMLVNATTSYNPDAADGPSLSLLREVEVEARVEGLGRKVNGEWRIVKSGSEFHSSQFTLDSSSVGIYVLNLPESLAVGQALECTLAVVLPDSAVPGDYGGWITISAVDTLGYTVQDSFYLAVGGPQARQNLDSLRVAPIPFKPHQNPEHDAIHFQGLSARAKVIVYDASGQSVWSATESGDGHLAWKAEVASGIYVYLVVSADGKSSKVGKLSVIR
jgi:hypothetical protein